MLGSSFAFCCGHSRKRMASLSDLRDALAALGLSTFTDGLRGEERRVLLHERLRDARRQLGIDDPSEIDHGPSHGETSAIELVYSSSQTGVGCDPAVDTYTNMTLGELRTALDDRGLSTQTPGLRGDARRHALLQRLLNAQRNGEVPPTLKQPDSEQGMVDDTAVLHSSRSSGSSTYSTAGEFFFFDTLGVTPSSIDHPQIPTLPLRPQHPPKLLQKSQKSKSFHRSGSQGQQSAATIAIQQQLEQELVRLRKELHDHRAARSKALTQYLQQSGFTANLETLAARVAALEEERQRLLRIAFGHELVSTAVISGYAMELVQEDAVQLIDSYQQKARDEIARLKEARAMVRLEYDETEKIRERGGGQSEQQLLRDIQRVQAQLQLFGPKPPHIASSGSLVKPEAPIIDSVGDSNGKDLPVLTRCQSVPQQLFHDTWRQLSTEQKRQLHHELRSAASLRMRRDRVYLGTVSARPWSNDSGVHASMSSQPGVLAFTRSPPTAADKTGIRALFLEQAHRGVSEIDAVYKNALALEPEHAINLGNYANFLYRRCDKRNDAETYFERAIAVDANSVANLARYANFLYRGCQDLPRAEEFYLRALQLNPNDELLACDYASLLRSRSLAAENTVSQLIHARKLLEDVLEQHPDHIGGRLQLAAVMSDMGDVREALQYYEMLVQDIDNRTSADNIGGGEAKGLPESPRAAQIMNEYAHVYGNFANFLKRQGQYDRAKSMYQRALQLHPREPLISQNLYVQHKRRLTPTPHFRNY